MDCSPPGSSVHGIFSGKNTGVGCQSSSRVSSQSMDRTHMSCIVGRFFTTEPPGYLTLFFLSLRMEKCRAWMVLLGEGGDYNWKWLRTIRARFVPRSITKGWKWQGTNQSSAKRLWWLSVPRGLQIRSVRALRCEKLKSKKSQHKEQNLLLRRRWVALGTTRKAIKTHLVRIMGCWKELGPHSNQATKPARRGHYCCLQNWTSMLFLQYPAWSFSKPWTESSYIFTSQAPNSEFGQGHLMALTLVTCSCCSYREDAK